MIFTLLDENTKRTHWLEVEELTPSHWDVWADTDGLNAVIGHIESQYGGALTKNHKSHAGYKSFYFYTYDYKALMKIFAEYFTRCGYKVRRK